MEDVAIVPLNKVCQSIAETREAINDLKAEEAGYEQTALSLMRRNERTTYQHAGVTLVRVPGEEKLQVKTTRERSATAEAPPTDAGPAPGDVAESAANDDTSVEG